MTYSTLISCKALKENLQNTQFRIFDCRYTLGDSDGGRLAYKEAHIIGAHYLHLNNDLSDLSIQGQGRHPLPHIDQFKQVLEKYAIDPSVQVVIYDEWHGGLAARMWWMLQSLGHENVAILNGGWRSWLSNGYETTSLESTLPQSVDISDLYRDSFTHTVSHADVEAACNNDSAHIIDSRTSERYNGISEPIDPIAGHIPSAINLPFLDNLDPSGHWKSKEELQIRFKDILDQYQANNTIFHCGSGVTACHNLLAIVHLGMKMPRLYVPSWSGWISDDSRAVITQE